jgi:hypothetical protein
MRVRLPSALVAGCTAGLLLVIPVAAPAADPPGGGHHPAAGVAGRSGGWTLRGNLPTEPHHGPRLSFTIR